MERESKDRSKDRSKNGRGGFGHGKKQIDPNLKPEELERQGYVRCIRLLGAREHSSTELKTKLGASGFSAETIDAVLQQLMDGGYQSDERFANLYSEQLLRKHYGPLVISSKLNARGINSSLSREAISAAINETGLSWAEVAADALMSKFSLSDLAFSQSTGSSDSHSAEELSSDQRDALREEAQLKKAKYARFLNRRGFSSTDSIKAIGLAAETVPE